ncbi:MAG: helix-turn-helix domain-containing protein [Thermaerobacter sp.]|nr:helix-turn-helix domain-containing protein [Thermaerobacter sp.]
MDAPLRSVQRAMQLLEALGRAQEPRPLHALSDELGLGKATVRRFLLTLQGLGYVVRDARGAYRLSGRIEEIARLQQPSADDGVRLALRELSQEAQVAASISRLEGSDVVYLYREPPGVVAGVALGEGARLPAHATAIGKVLLAHRPAAEMLERYPDGVLPAYTERTITELPLLLGALQEIRRQGWALSDGEMEAGLCAAAVPVYGTDGRLLCALNASASGGSRAREAFVTDIVPALLKYAKRFGELMAEG